MDSCKNNFVKSSYEEQFLLAVFCRIVVVNFKNSHANHPFAAYCDGQIQTESEHSQLDDGIA